jgi:hypothetical protein
MKSGITFCLALLFFIFAPKAEARMEDDAHNELLPFAEQFGRCGDREGFKILEGVYNRCNASDRQLDQIHENYDKGDGDQWEGDKKAMCGSDLGMRFYMKAAPLACNN